MFRRMGETRHVQHRTPPLAGQIGWINGKINLESRTVEGPDSRPARSRPRLWFLTSPRPNCEVYLSQPEHGSRESSKTKILGSVAFKRDEWDALEKRAERKAQTEPGLVAQMAEAAAACLGGALLAPPSPKAAPQRNICDSPRGGDERRRRVRRPRRRGQEEPPPQDDGLAARLSATLCSLSLDDASWLGDVIDTSFDGVERSRIQRLGRKDPRTISRGTGPAAAAPPPPTMSTSSAGLKLSASIDDWGGTLVGRPLTSADHNRNFTSVRGAASRRRCRR